MRLPSEPSLRDAEGLPSGVDPIDREWGGLYRGGAYLVYGRAASGRGLLTMRLAATGLMRGERCLFVASERIRDLAVEASSIGLDLRRARQQGTIHVTRVPQIVNLRNDGDEAVARAVTDLVALIRRERPERVVVNDFLPFVMFRDFDRFTESFVGMLESLDTVESTLVIALPEPANDQSRRVVEFVSTKMTGTIHVEPFDYDPSSPERRLTLTPHVGHLGGRVVSRWDLSAIVQLPSELPHGPPVLVSREPGPATPEPGYPAAPTGPAAQDAPPRDRAVKRGTPVQDPGEPRPATAPGETGTAESASGPPRPPDAAGPPVSDTGRFVDRESFIERLDEQFSRREQGADPFLLLAMRLDPDDDGTGPFDFEFIIDLVSESLGADDRVLLDAERERLVVWLAEATPDDAQDFFARLRGRLENEAPQRADELLHAVSAIVVPDGRPFQTAREFLGYALDED